MKCQVCGSEMIDDKGNCPICENKNRKRNTNKETNIDIIEKEVYKK